MTNKTNAIRIPQTISPFSHLAFPIKSQPNSPITQNSHEETKTTDSQHITNSNHNILTRHPSDYQQHFKRTGKLNKINKNRGTARHIAQLGVRKTESPLELRNEKWEGRNGEGREKERDPSDL